MVDYCCQILRKEVATMPNLKHLLEELEDLDVEPKEIKMNPLQYDEIIAKAEEIADDDK